MLSYFKINFHILIRIESLISSYACAVLLYMSYCLCTVTVIWSVKTELDFACYQNYSSEAKCSLQPALYCGQLLQLRLLENWEDAFQILPSALRCHLFLFAPLPSSSNMACKEGVYDSAYWLKILLLSTACHKRKSEQCFHCVLACVSHQEMWNAQKFLQRLGLGR